ncbi:hypothetical protein BASA50_009211 [Batrachochytrium salamandrivorans]|uniref:Extracellular metalloproteinase n=1 Tax=Batrachochytrium salamandrivorans TaxID=1357716 RepID=A0ABQ8F1Y3_9FUNG|nr:hypothetical protein BASA50_009211 [Batrachochytrium salamandrivorans]
MFGPALTLILALASSTVIAVPTVDNVYKRAVASLNPLSTVLPFHFPESVYENIPHSDAVSSSFSEKDDVKTATDYISNKLNLGADDFKVVNSFTDTAGVTHVYGAHMVNDVRIANHQAAAHVKNGQVTSFSSSFGTAQHFSKRDLAVSEAKATLDFEGASATASAQLGIPVYSEFEHALEYVEQPDGKIAYAYKLQLRNNPVTKWVQVWCDATTGKVIQAVDFAHKASYKAIALPRRDISGGFSLLSNPEFTGSSPNGWVSGNTTEGNNVITSNPSGKTTPSTSNGVFDTKFNGRDEPSTDDNVAAAAVNLFYLANAMHDITYQYGFTESAGNFQKDNFGRGGKGGDAVIVNVLDTSDVNNAKFITPPDGQSGVMRMGTDTANNSIPMGAYVTNRPGGIRSRPYTADININPLTYVDLQSRTGVHAIGEVWASMLWDVYWNLVAKRGFSANLYNASQAAGNIVTMKIIIGGMMIQQCNPTFLNARDAVIAADATHYRGDNKCEIYKAFAKRGLGFKATNTRKNDFSIPPECEDAPSPDATSTTNSVEATPTQP